MFKPALVVYGDGDLDTSRLLTLRGADWQTDPYGLSEGPKCLLSIFGGQHGLGGVAGCDGAETKDENPEQGTAVQRLTRASLRSTLFAEDAAWPNARATFVELKELGSVECT